MEFDPSFHGYEGKIHADRCTVEYFGRGNHSSDAVCFRTTQSVGSCVVATTVNHAETPRLDTEKPQPSKEQSRHVDADSSSNVRLFYYEMLVLATGEMEEDDEDVELIRIEHLRAAARRTSLHNNGNSNTNNNGAIVGRRTNDTAARMPWRVRARQLIQSHIRASEPNAAQSAEDSVENEEDEERAQGHTDFAESVGNHSANGNINSGSTGRVSQNEPWRVTGSSVRVDAGLNGEDEEMQDVQQQRQRQPGRVMLDDDDTVDLTLGSPLLRRFNGNSSSSPLIDLTGSSGSSGVHFAFTLSSRTLQQIRSRHDRRRLRRSHDKRRLNHRISMGFTLSRKAKPSHESNHTSDHPMDAGERSNNNVTAMKEEIEDVDASRRISRVDLGKNAFSLGYVGKTGRIMSNGQEFLQCERYGAGDVVGCGILYDSKTFFFTLNGKLMGMLAATDVHHFEEFLDEDEEHGGDSEGSAVDGAEEVVNMDMMDDVDYDLDMALRDHRSSGLLEKSLYPSISLHDPGECARGIFNVADMQFDLVAFQQQIQKERQRTLQTYCLAGQEEEKDDRIMHALLEDYFIHYGYQSAFNTFQSLLSTSRKRNLSMEVDSDDGNETEEKKTDPREEYSKLSDSPTQHQWLALRHSIRQFIYSFQTALAIQKLEVAIDLQFFRNSKLQFYCHVLCVIDVLTTPTTPASGGTKHGKTKRRRSSDSNRGEHSAWNVEKAIVFAQEILASYLTPPWATKPAIDDDDSEATTEKNSESPSSFSTYQDVEQLMSLFVYESLDHVPSSNRGRKFLTPEFREYVADEVNLLLLESSASSSPRSPLSSSLNGVSAMENFLVDLQTLSSECLRNGCRVFPGNNTISGKRKHMRRRRHTSSLSEGAANGHGSDEQLSSSSDDSSSSSQSDQDDDDDNDDDDDDEEEEEE